jgi:hypothetical protein
MILRIIMTAETIRSHTDLVMTAITKLLPAGMAFTAFVQSQLSPLAVTNYFLTDSTQKFPVMIAHIVGIPDTLFVNRIGSFQKRLGTFGAAGKHIGNEAVRQWNQYNYYWN